MKAYSEILKKNLAAVITVATFCIIISISEEVFDIGWQVINKI